MKVISTEKAPAAIGPYSQAMTVKQYDFYLRTDSLKSPDRRNCGGNL